MQQDFEGIVEARRIAHILFQDPEPFSDAQLLTHGCLARTSPPAVGANGVDLAVVSHEAEGLRQKPVGMRVCGIALVEHGEGTLEVGASQVRVKSRKLPGGEQAFVNHGPRGKRAEIDATRRCCLDPLAAEEEQPLQIFPRAFRSKETLPDGGQSGHSARPQKRSICRHDAPAQAS